MNQKIAENGYKVKMNLSCEAYQKFEILEVENADDEIVYSSAK